MKEGSKKGGKGKKGRREEGNVYVSMTKRKNEGRWKKGRREGGKQKYGSKKGWMKGRQEGRKEGRNVNASVLRVPA
jgi:hypothetical protein